MKSLHRHLLTAGLLAGLGLGAIAQTAAPAVVAPAPTPSAQKASHAQFDPARAEKRHSRMQERMAKRLVRLKEKLQISAGQEGAWQAWTAALKPAQKMQGPARGELRQLSTPERIDRMRSLRAQRSAEMDRRGEATKSFYAALSAEQQKTFDGIGQRMGQPGGKHHHRGGHRHHGHHHGG